MMSERKKYKIVFTRDMRYMVTLGTTEMYTAKTKEDAEFILKMFIQADIDWAEYNDTAEQVRKQQAHITQLEAELQACKADNAEKARLLNQLIDDGAELEAELARAKASMVTEAHEALLQYVAGGSEYTGMYGLVRGINELGKAKLSKWEAVKNAIKKRKLAEAKASELEAENESLHTQLRETLQLLSQYRQAYERDMLAGSDETTAPSISDQDTQELPVIGDYDD